MLTRSSRAGSCTAHAARPRTLQGRRRSCDIGRLRRMCVRSSDEEQTRTTAQEVPVFPLDMVAMPAVDTLLNIFEARYRVLFHTLLDGEDGVSQDLVQKDSPFRGSKRFGMCFVAQGGLCAYGTVLEITKHQVQADGRLVILCTGKERFRIRDITQEKPVLHCSVELLPDEGPGEGEESDKAAKLLETASANFKALLRMNAEYEQTPADASLLDPPELKERTPGEAAFWLAHTALGDKAAQQAVLELPTAMQRLEVVNEALDGRVKRMAAAKALRSVFASPTTTPGAPEDTENTTGAGSSDEVQRGGGASADDEASMSDASTDAVAGSGSEAGSSDAAARDGGADASAAGDASSSAKDAAQSSSGAGDAAADGVSASGAGTHAADSIGGSAATDTQDAAVPDSSSASESKSSSDGEQRPSTGDKSKPD